MDYDTCIENYKYLFNADLLRNKVAFVTGGGSGIGFTITEILMRHGCNTAIASRNLERVQNAAAKLQRATGQKCLALQMDVRKPETIMKAFDETLRIYKKIDIVVNNAAGNFLSPAAGLSFNAFKTVIEIDTLGTFNTSKVAYEKYLRDHGGVIINISANLPYRGQVLQSHAGSAKAAIDALTKHLAVEWGPDNIRVVGLAPGPIAGTEGMRRLGGRHGDEDIFKTIVPIGRAGTKEEMGHAVLFLASPAGGYFTGTTVTADGGAWMVGPNSMHDAVLRMTEVTKARQKSKI